jgi:hypothetical protein
MTTNQVYVRLTPRISYVGCRVCPKCQNLPAMGAKTTGQRAPPSRCSAVRRPCHLGCIRECSVSQMGRAGVRVREFGPPGVERADWRVRVLTQRENREYGARTASCRKWLGQGQVDRPERGRENIAESVNRRVGGSHTRRGMAPPFPIESETHRSIDLYLHLGSAAPSRGRTVSRSGPPQCLSRLALRTASRFVLLAAQLPFDLTGQLVKLGPLRLPARTQEPLDTDSVQRRPPPAKNNAAGLPRSRLSRCDGCR